jgi:hypothetical protein
MRETRFGCDQFMLDVATMSNTYHSLELIGTNMSRNTSHKYDIPEDEEKANYMRASVNHFYGGEFFEKDGFFITTKGSDMVPYVDSIMPHPIIWENLCHLRKKYNRRDDLVLAATRDIMQLLSELMSSNVSMPRKNRTKYKRSSDWRVTPADFPEIVHIVHEQYDSIRFYYISVPGKEGLIFATDVIGRAMPIMVCLRQTHCMQIELPQFDLCDGFKSPYIGVRAEHWNEDWRRWKARGSNLKEGVLTLHPPFDVLHPKIVKRSRAPPPDSG